MYQTESYLPALLESFDNQELEEFALEFIFVDDGSSDSSAQLAESWLERSGAAGKVLRRQNGGVAAARNAGIDFARGQWITFPDSDDFLNTRYFANAARSIAAHGEAVLLSANVLRFQEDKRKSYADHPLRFKFGSTKPVNLLDDPTYIQTQAASAFFRLDLVNRNEVRFVDGLRVAEDAAFTSAYLLRAGEPVIAPVRGAKYYYRRRADSSSTSNSYRDNPDFYFGRFERGYLPLLKEAKSYGEVPVWLQNVVLYDLSWYFRREVNPSFKASHLSATDKERALRLLEATLRYIDETSITNYRITAISAEARALMLTLGGHRLPAVGMVRIAKNRPGSFELSYLYQRKLPKERIERAGRPLVPLVAKTRQLDYFGQSVLFERIIRLPKAKAVTLYLDDAAQLLHSGAYHLGSSEVSAVGTTGRKARLPRPGKVWKQIVSRLGAEVACWTGLSIVLHPPMIRKGRLLRESRFRAFNMNFARSPKKRRRYRRAWLLMDKIGGAGDNAEYLYEYLRSHRPEVNAWFVIRKDSADWKRLKRRGFRLIAYRSAEHKIALQLAAVVASSQLDLEIVEPIPTAYYSRRRRPWIFVYLQHGVLQHDLAHWFNAKDIDILTTASVDEHESIVADGTHYRLTTDSVVLTGFPRHDAIAGRVGRRPWAQRRSILIAPTWRNGLFLPKASFGAQRELRRPLLETEYGKQWMAFMSHPALARLAFEYSAEIVFLPHPNLRRKMPGVNFPSYVRAIEGPVDSQELMCNARVTITDYSSVFFDAALVESRVVYFQFDRDEFIHGSHTYVEGYWSYERHGFGPVATDVEAAVRFTVDGFQKDESAWPAKYRERVKRCLPLVDGRSAERITDLIHGKFGV